MRSEEATHISRSKEEGEVGKREEWKAKEKEEKGNRGDVEF
jgi:hypothetical protein